MQRHQMSEVLQVVILGGQVDLAVLFCDPIFGYILFGELPKWFLGSNDLLLSIIVYAIHLDAEQV